MGEAAMNAAKGMRTVDEHEPVPDRKLPLHRATHEIVG